MPKYVVWRRNDGYIGASVASKPRDYPTGGVWETVKERAERVAAGLPLAGAGVMVTFESLGEYDSWDEALDKIKLEI